MMEWFRFSVTDATNLDEVLEMSEDDDEKEIMDPTVCEFNSMEIYNLERFGKFSSDITYPNFGEWPVDHVDEKFPDEFNLLDPLDLNFLCDGMKQERSSVQAVADCMRLKLARNDLFTDFDLDKFANNAAECVKYIVYNPIHSTTEHINFYSLVDTKPINQYSIKNIRSLKNIDDIKWELVNHGPVIANMIVWDDFSIGDAYVHNHTIESKLIGQINVLIVGWKGSAWILRNCDSGKVFVMEQYPANTECGVDHPVEIGGVTTSLPFTFTPFQVPEPEQDYFITDSFCESIDTMEHVMDKIQSVGNCVYNVAFWTFFALVSLVSKT